MVNENDSHYYIIKAILKWNLNDVLNRQTIMRNRQGEQEKAMDTELNQKELMRKVSDAGYQHNHEDQRYDYQTPVLSGDVSFNQLPSGLNIHSTEATEQSDWQMSCELSPLISVNFLLEGEVSFALDDKEYQFSAANGPVVFVNLITRTQVFKRKFKAGVKVKKLNISVDQQWLLARCSETSDKESICQLFSLEPSVFFWSCSARYEPIIQDLLRLNEQKSLVASLETEQLAFQLMLKCYQQLINLEAYNRTKPAPLLKADSDPDAKYEKQISELITHSLSLNELSQKLGASVSTLQRYFKNKHQMTLKQYVRNQKLELARRELLFEDKSIGEAAYTAGYNHPSNFIKAFKSYFLMTPVELLKHHHQAR